MTSRKESSEITSINNLPANESRGGSSLIANSECHHDSLLDMEKWLASLQPKQPASLLAF